MTSLVERIGQYASTHGMLTDADREWFGRAAPAILALVEENARLRATNTRLYTIILENRADTTIADNGMTVWDGLQNEARQALGEPK